MLYGFGAINFQKKKKFSPTCPRVGVSWHLGRGKLVNSTSKFFNEMNLYFITISSEFKVYSIANINYLLFIIAIITNITFSFVCATFVGPIFALNTLYPWLVRGF